MTIEVPTPAGDATDDGTSLPADRPLPADPPAPPGVHNLAELVDEMEQRVLHGEEEAAHEEREDTDAEAEAPDPEDVDPSGGDPV